MATIVRESGTEKQLALLRAHPELAGKAMVSKSLTAESPTSRTRPAWPTARRRSSPGSSS
jgi:N-carbamoyl-L-amino-acid hydrolase